jgi:hypothetical protein
MSRGLLLRAASVALSQKLKERARGGLNQEAGTQEAKKLPSFVMPKAAPQASQVFPKPAAAIDLPAEKSAKKWQDSLEEFAKSLLQHAAQDGAAFDYLQGDGQVAKDKKIDRKKVASGATYIYQIAAASQVFFSASVASATLSEKGFAGLAEIKKSPKILVDGVSMMFLYNIFATEAALMVGAKIRGDSDSSMRAMSSILASSFTETVIGNPLDFYSLEKVFSLTKIEHGLKSNPSFFAALRADKDLFKGLVPQALQESSNEELSRNCAKLNFSEKNVAALKLLKPELNLSAKEWAKMNAAGSTFAALRNINFYLLTHLINQSNAAAKDGEGKELTAAEITAIGTLGSAITSPLNMAAYSAAFRSIEGADMFEAMKQGLKHAFADTAKNPRIFACLVALRATATLLCSEIFSDKTRETIGGIVDGLADAISSIAKAEEKSKKPDGEVGGKKDGRPAEPKSTSELFRGLLKQCVELQESVRKKEGAEAERPASSSKPLEASKASSAKEKDGRSSEC